MSFIVPDWRVESNYADPQQETNLEFWAWEFLRRRESYKADWALYAECLRALAERLPALAKHVDDILQGTTRSAPLEQSEEFHRHADALELLHFSPPRLAGETMEDWEQRVASGPKRAYMVRLDIFLGGKNGIDRLINPALPYRNEGGLPLVRFLTSGVTYKQHPAKPLLGDVDAADHVLFGSRLIVEFDMRAPDSVLVAQLQAALARQRRRIEERTGTEYKPLRPNKSLPAFRNYLRALDALAVGVNPLEITAHLSKHKAKEQQDDDAANWIARAVELRDSQCTNLPLYQSIITKKKNTRGAKGN